MSYTPILDYFPRVPETVTRSLMHDSTTCPSCRKQREHGHDGGKGASTSARVAQIYERAESCWFDTALRRRLPDCQRSKWKARFCARAVTLLSFWRKPR